MDITLNGDPRSIPDQTSVAELLALLGLTPERVAVERNEALVRRAQFGETRLAPGDRVEIVTLVGGG